MIKGGVPPAEEPAAPAQRLAFTPAAPAPATAGPARGDAASAFTLAVRKSEAKAQALAVQYTQRYPAIAQYGWDWMSCPDLRKLTNSYMVDHDPVAFLRGVAASKDFPELAGKYAADPAVRAFVKDALKGMPRDVLAASSDLLVQDGVMRDLLAGAGKGLGLPQSFTDGLANYGKTPPPAPPAR
jgi:hypothetical protein